MFCVKQILMIAFAVSGVGAALSAQAQTAPPPTRDCAEIAARAASRLSYLQTKLAITTSEQSAWNAYAAAITAGAQTETAACNALPTTLPTNYPTRFADSLQLSAARLQAGQTILPALQALYAALTTQQQAILNGPTAPSKGSFARH